MPDNADININLNLTWGNGKRLDKSDLEKPASLAIDKIGFYAAKNRQRKLKANLQRDFVPVVERELQKMARDISRMGIGLANPNNPPPGNLSITGRVSRYMTSSSPMSIASMTGVWATRTKAYMKRKVKKYRTRRWFKNTGRLQKQLADVGTYRSAHGPISVKFTPTGLSEGRVSTLGRSRGGQSRNIMIGRLEVKPFRRMSVSDLPGIGQKASYNRVFMSRFADSVARKLTGQPSKGKYRPVVEPFMSYYMERKIPNAVLLKLEDSLT